MYINEYNKVDVNVYNYIIIIDRSNILKWL